MKRCPACTRVYDGDHLRFCLDDGTELVDKTPEASAPPTAILPSSAGNQTPTITAPPPVVAAVTDERSQLGARPAAKKRGAWPWILGAGALLLILGAAIVVSALFLFPKPPLVWHLVLEIDPSTQNREAVLKQSVAIIESRLNALGVRNFEVKPQGNLADGRIVINLPSVADPERVKQVIVSQGKLELVHVLSPPSPAPPQTFPSKEEAIASFASSGELPLNRRILANRERSEPGDPVSNWVVVESPAIVDGSDLRDAQAVRESFGDNYQINFSLKKTGAAKFGAWTGANINEYLGVVLNDEVRSIAFIKSQIYDQGQISGRFTRQSAEDLALVLKSGALPAAVKLVEERVNN